MVWQAFYFDLVAKRTQAPYQKLIQGGDYQHDGRTYAFEGIGTVLAYFAYARFVLKSNIVSSSHGFTIKNASYSEPLPLEERRNFYHESRKDAHSFFEQLKSYLDRHPADYPSWKCSGSCSITVKKPMEAFVKKYIGEFIAAMIAGFATWSYKRKISKAEVDNAILRNSQKIMDMYKGMTNDMKAYYDTQVDTMKRRICELEIKHEQSL